MGPALAQLVEHLTVVVYPPLEKVEPNMLTFMKICFAPLFLKVGVVIKMSLVRIRQAGKIF